MSRCNSYNEENNNDFDNKQIVIKNDAKIIIKNYVKIVKNVGENVVENVMENVVSRCGGESMYTTPPASNNASHTPAMFLSFNKVVSGDIGHIFINV